MLSQFGNRASVTKRAVATQTGTEFFESGAIRPSLGLAAREDRQEMRAVLKIRKLVERPFDSVVVSGNCAEHCAVGFSDSDPPSAASRAATTLEMSELVLLVPGALRRDVLPNRRIAARPAAERGHAPRGRRWRRPLNEY